MTVSAHARATPLRFKEVAHEALGDPNLQDATNNFTQGMMARRAAAVANMPEFELLRDSGEAIKNHVLVHLDAYLEIFEKKVVENGGKVHFAENAEEARQAVLDICRAAGGKSVTKGKSMVTEEIALNDLLDEVGLDPVETDLGEYIIQLRHELPTHIVVPAVHLKKEQIEADFRKAHKDLPEGRDLTAPEDLLAEARAVLRKRFLAADIGITGANMLVAETGSAVIVTNEGNGDLTQTLSRVHIVVTTIEKLVPTLNDAAQILRLLARSATGQEITCYTTFASGPRRPGDPDGPEEFHVVLLDNGRASLVGGAFQEVLRCIKCGACMNHCPVYNVAGGHAYGHVYPGPIGAVIVPAIKGIEVAKNLPNASTFCGRCEEVCPMRIPLPKMMRYWREKEFERKLPPTSPRFGLAIWAFAARRPALYRLLTRAAMAVLGALGRKEGRFKWLPLAGGWTRYRDFPAPEGETFQAAYARRKK